MKKFVKLFCSVLYLSAFTFGGGYVIVTLMRKKFVDEYHWIDEEEMLDLVAIAQSAPGPIAVNGAIVLGYKLYKIGGVILCVIATILPPFIIISIVSFFYQILKENIVIALLLEGMQAGVGAVICSVVYDMVLTLRKQKVVYYYLVLILSFIANYIFNVNVVYIILICIVLGLLISFHDKEKEV